ncbi:solute carrier family 13 member 2-like [Mizuhopecten yessoensis]|uniref:Solute carrier family 13 member 3 n=1 Tax=Mizuhopecten yessoensis TaxID=6573 RepID=A0A210QNF5_MIZYE|nr:solute carrier family 13 member 2-like [Mizuhopecten yessoensis]OWF50270.1 Solute carrier family 13 member 3 [Mizuhopecten yessoensis]
MVKQTLKNIWVLRQLLVVVLAPFFLLPIVFAVEGKESKCAYIIFVMAIFWITEALPIAVTALLPVVLFPVVGIMNAKDISTAYVNDTSMLFVGGLILAHAIEHWNIHKLFALRVLLWFGSEPHWLMLGMMIPTWFLSMWMSNTATAVMMLPIANAVLLQLQNIHSIDQGTHEEDVDQSDPDSKSVVIASEQASNESDNGLDQEAYMYDDEQHLNLCKALSMSICYAANIGGIATLTGTGVNVIMKGQSDLIFQKYDVDNPITFATWMQFGVPIATILLFMAWTWLVIYFLGLSSICRRQPREISNRIRKVLRREYEELGSITFAQGAVIGHFITMSTLWITRDLGGVGGWKDLFPEKTVSDSTSCILVSCSLFFFPANLPEILRCGMGGTLKYQPLLSWKSAERNISWGIIWLFGGGFALAKGSQETGLSDWIGEQLSVFSGLEIWVLNLILCYIVAAFTEVTSNSATATLILPIVIQLGLKLEVNPLYVTLPVTIAASISFMLPVATPPNAVVFSYGYITVIDMIKTGLPMNIVPIPIVVLLTEFLGNSIFDLKTFPTEFRNATISV